MEKSGKKKRKSSKKRKADTNGDAPPLKKSKTKKSSKKALNETEEEWQKYVKLQKGSGGGAGKKKGETPNSGAGKKPNKQEKKKKKKSNPLLKQREPCDLMCNKVRSDALTQELKEAEENNEQKALAVNVMPERERQTVETLALGIEEMDVMPITYNDVDFDMTLKRMNYERTPVHAYPLQDLMGDHGFFSINNEHVEHVLKCIIKDKRADIAYAKSTGARNPLNRKKGDPSKLIAGDTSNKKLNQVCGNNFQSFGYNRRTPQIQHNKMKAQDAIDRLERFKEFFKNDELDEDETNYGDVPDNYNMFRNLRRDKGDKFNRRTDQLRLCAALTPKADVEQVSKEQILDARQPPGTGDALCSHGTKCIFNNFSADKAARYIGKVFYSEREKARRLKRRVEGTFDEEDEGEGDEEWESRNVHRLCIDCLFKRWTIQWAMNIRNEVIPERQINYFTVQCKRGQYSPHCMLSMVENNKPTGIVGHVPRFSLNNRRIVTHQRHRRTDNKYETVSVPMLVETESVSTKLFLREIKQCEQPRWWDDFQLSFDHSLIVDRHFLSEIESKVCIASIDEPICSSPCKSTIDSLRLILAQKYNNPPLNFRELPVSLLRLYFSGKQRLTRFIARLPHNRLNTLVHYLEQDGLSLSSFPLSSDDEQDAYTDPVYKQKCLAIEAYITALLDYCFCSFEHTLSHIIQTKWYHFGLTEALKHASHWANFPVPPDEKNHCIWVACVWRINVTLTLSKLLWPWDDEQGKEWFNYQCKLFRDTHLDLLSMMCKKAVYDDESITTKYQLLREYYPLCNRVCCAEELPDFVGYATDNFKTGSNLKERSSLDDKIGHLFVNKTGPNICKIRNFYDIIIRYGEEDPIIYDTLKNVIKCVLLGNLPHSRGDLNMVARIKINLAFFAEEADVVIPEDVFKELTKNKSMKRNRSKKKTKDELVYTKTKFILWLLLCRHFVLYLLKEFLFYIAESSQWFDEILSVDYKYIRYKEIVLIGNGQCRKKLSEQAASQRLDESFDWSVIEFEEKSTETYDTKSGEIKKFHAWSLTVARKVQKDDFMKILAKKMTNTEESIVLTTPYRPFYYVSQDGEVASKERVISLEELHFICWCMSKNRSRIMETRWFQVMGMSKQGLETLRLWLFLYNTYDIPDNSLKKLIKEFHTQNATDYMILKTVIKLIEYYKQEHVFHLPISYAKKQIYALRRLLGVEDWEVTPPLLGFAYQCSGCHKFANTIIEPVDHSHKQRPLTHQHTCHTKTPLPLATKTSVWASTSGSSSSSAHNTQTALGKTGKKGSHKIRKILGLDGTITTSTKRGVDKDGGDAGNNVTSCFLNTAFYNMDDGKLYCPKYSSNYKHTLLGDNLANGQIIMRKKDNSVIIRSNKAILLDGDKVVETGNQSTLPPSLSPGGNARKLKKMGHSNSQANKEREAKKFLWLLERRVFEFNDANGGDALNDNIACGLFATLELPQEEDPEAGITLPLVNTTVSPISSSSSTTATTKTILTTSGAKGSSVGSVSKKNTNKKVILGYVNKAIIDMGLTCNKELNCIDMVGIVKNGKVLCVECGSMTEMRNYNITNHGITCGRHKNVYDSDYTMDPIVSNPDKRSASTVAIDSPRYVHTNETDQQRHTITTMMNPLTNSVLYHHHHNAVTHHTLKSHLHPLDIVQKGAHYTRQSGHIEGEHCAYCSLGTPKYRITGAGHHKQIVKVALCKPCYDLCSPVIAKHTFLLLSDIYTHLKAKKPL